MLSVIYQVPFAQAQTDVAQLIDQLRAENLVVPATSTPSDQIAVASPTEQPYAAPRLEIFRDMSAMFALDPPMPSLRSVDW